MSMAVARQGRYAEKAGRSSEHDELALIPPTLPLPCQPVFHRLIREHAEYRRLSLSPHREGAPHELLHCRATGADAGRAFDKLRWGGLCVLADSSKRAVLDAIQRFTDAGFGVETALAKVREGWSIPFFGKRTHYTVLRKITLLPPGEFTDRFTYAIRLVGGCGPDDPVCVEKTVPTYEAVCARLKSKFPDIADEIIDRRARKFTEKIFPLFLTREAGMLLVLEEHLPAAYRRRVPKLLDMKKDTRGFVTQLRMTWLRNGGRPLPQMEFARQAADLLRVLHDIGHVMHLDLRLDNMVITPDGVGFVDFGSSVKDDEDLSQNPLLGQIFGELMKTSQIQRMLDHMSTSGQVTSHTLMGARQKADKAVDLFYLALQFQTPHANPDLADLIEFDPNSREHRQLKELSEEVLRPKNAAAPTYRSAKDLLHGIERIALGLDRG